MYLKGKRVLFIGPEFYNYHNEIISEMLSCGAKVKYFPEMLSTLSYRFARHYSEKYRKVLEEKYLNKILNDIEGNYDYFFLIRGEIINTSFLDKLKIKMPNMVFLMYQWDSCLNNPNYLNIMSYFDRIKTFDMVDAKEKKLDYLPLFYTKEYENLELSSSKQYDIVFFGAYHSDRLKIVKELHQKCLEMELNFYSVVYITKMAFLMRLLKGELTFSDYNYVNFKSVDKNTILSVYEKTKSVLDIESLGQQGLTIRTFEVLGSSIKLLTTNQNIKCEPFYNNKIISLLHRGSIKNLEKSFFDSNCFENESIKEYSLSKWTKKIFVDNTTSMT